MSGEDEGFLRRWSRRKQAASVRVVEHRPPEPTASPQVVADAIPEDSAPAPEPDLSALPPLESIGPTTDISGFLQKGVPLDLTRAALRRAWSEDPAIRNFVEVAENQWDFATGSDIPGFGALEEGADIDRMVADIVGNREMPESRVVSPEATVPAETGQDQASACGRPPPSPSSVAMRSDTEAQIGAAEKSDDAATQQENRPEETKDPHPARRHGGALPQ